MSCRLSYEHMLEERSFVENACGMGQRSWRQCPSVAFVVMLSEHKDETPLRKWNRWMRWI